MAGLVIDVTGSARGQKIVEWVQWIVGVEKVTVTEREYCGFVLMQTMTAMAVGKGQLPVIDSCLWP